MRTIAVANQKGGCGKTTTAVTISTALADLGNRVLTVDLDAQGHATLGLGHEPDSFDNTVYDLITNPQAKMSSVIVSSNDEQVSVIPSNILLSGVEVELSTTRGREHILKNRLEEIADDFDMCVIDCSPSLSLLTLNALVASTDVIIPLQVHYYALEGLKQLLETIDIVKERFNPGLEILGVLLTFVEDRTSLSRQIQSQMRDFFGDLVFETVIHKTVRLAEAPSAGKSVLTYAPNCRGTADYKALAREICYGKTQDGVAQGSFLDI